MMQCLAKKLMITLLSPTKTQSTLAAHAFLQNTKPSEIEKANFLISLLAKLTTDELSKIMGISDSLAMKTKSMIAEWGVNEGATTQSLFLFQGDAFQKLDAASLTEDDQRFAQNHLIILSALYGYLSVSDVVSAYRLDMKDSLKIPKYQNLYAYWKETVTAGLNNVLSMQKNNIVLNLASSEYFDVIDRKKLNGNIVNVEFKVHKDNSYKTVGIYAKRGRGLLARYIIKNRIDSPHDIIKFNSDGFQFSEKFSTHNNYVFVL